MIEKFEVTGVGYDRKVKENLKTARNYFEANFYTSPEDAVFKSLGLE